MVNLMASNYSHCHLMLVTFPHLFPHTSSMIGEGVPISISNVANSLILYTNVKTIYLCAEREKRKLQIERVSLIHNL